MKFPFYDAPNTATITCCHILENGEPILYVSHDEDDGMWQFLCGKAHETDEAKLVSLKCLAVTMLKEKLKMMNGVLENGNYQLGQFKFVWIIFPLKRPLALRYRRSSYILGNLIR